MTDDLSKPLIDIARAGASRPVVPDSTDLDDHIRNAMYDATIDGEGWPDAHYVRHHLAKRGLRIVQTEADEPLISALKECQAALASIIERRQIAGVTVTTAWANCVAAETRVRAALAKAGAA